jgi:carbon-monoxide dehydrogenase medium subunit
MKLRLAQPKHLVDLRKISSLTGIKEEAGTLVIGAMATHHAVESSSVVKSKQLMLADVAQIGDPMVRNMGTIGGSLAHADPAADYPPPSSRSAPRWSPRTEGQADHQGRRLLQGTSPPPSLRTILTEVRIPARQGGRCLVKFPHPASRFAVSVWPRC